MELQNYFHIASKNYRTAYKIFASNGILFNHESQEEVKILLQGSYKISGKILCE